MFMLQSTIHSKLHDFRVFGDGDLLIVYNFVEVNQSWGLCLCLITVRLTLGFSTSFSVKNE
jgi:hypothetical protein